MNISIFVNYINLKQWTLLYDFPFLIPFYQVVQGNYPLVDQQIELGNNRTSCMLYKGAYTDTYFFNNSKKTTPRFVILNL